MSLEEPWNLNIIIVRTRYVRPAQQQHWHTMHIHFAASKHLNGIQGKNRTSSYFPADGFAKMNLRIRY